MRVWHRLELMPLDSAPWTAESLTDALVPDYIPNNALVTFDMDRPGRVTVVWHGDSEDEPD